MKNPETGEKFEEPTDQEPDFEDLERMVLDGVAEATDGCIVEPDGWRSFSAF